MPPTPQPRTPRPLIIVVWESVSHQGVGVGEGRLGVTVLRRHDAARQVHEVHLVDDAVAGGTTRKFSKAVWPSAGTGSAPRALELPFGIDQERCGRAVLVDLHGVVDHQLGRLQRVDAGSIAAHGSHRIAHRGQVGHRGDSREVLEQHPSGHEGDFDVRFGWGSQRATGLDVVRRNDSTVLAAEQVLEQDLQGIRQALNRQAGGSQSWQVSDPEGPAGGGHRSYRAKAVRHV